MALVSLFMIGLVLCFQQQFQRGDFMKELIFIVLILFFAFYGLIQGFRNCCRGFFSLIYKYRKKESSVNENISSSGSI